MPVIKSVILAGMCALVGCGSDKAAPLQPEPTAAEHIADGWISFEASPPDYSSALNSFSEALDIEPENVEALTGRGWCYAYLAVGSNDIKYIRASEDFTKAVENDNTYNDALVGLGLVKYVQNEYQSASIFINLVLDSDPDYVFSHDPDVTWADLTLVQAHGYFIRGQYSNVVEILDELQPGVEHPVNKPEVLLVQIQELWGTI